LFSENVTHGREGDIEQERAEEVDGFESGGKGRDDRTAGSGGFRALLASSPKAKTMEKKII